MTKSIIKLWVSVIIVCLLALPGAAEITRQQATDQIAEGIFPKTITLGNNHVEALMRFPNIESCLERSGRFDGRRDLNWAAFEHASEIVFCGYWAADYFRDFTNLEEWVARNGHGFDYRYAIPSDKTSRRTALRIDLISIEELTLYKSGILTFFWWKPRSAHLEIWITPDHRVGNISVLVNMQ